MGIRFACHVCERRLNIKQELAGRRGICPVCAARIRIPLSDTDKSTPVDHKPEPQPAFTSSADAGPIGATATSGFRDDTATRPSPAKMPRQEARATSPAGASNAPAAAGMTGVQGAAVQNVGDPIDDDVMMNLLSESVEPAPEESQTPQAERADWYVRPPTGGQYGPATTEVLKQWIDEGRVAATALLWREGWAQWRDANEALPEYAGRLPDLNAPASAGPSTDPSVTPVIPATPVGRDRGAGVSPKADPMPASASKTKRRVLTIGILSVVALSLILVLAFVLFR